MVGGGHDWGGVLADGGADTHKEAVMLSVLDPSNAMDLESKNIEGLGEAYPKVAPDPSMYCPKLRMTPFGPAPYLMILTDPKIKPIIAPTARKCKLPFYLPARCEGCSEENGDILPPIIAPIFTTGQLVSHPSSTF